MLYEVARWHLPNIKSRLCVSNKHDKVILTFWRWWQQYHNSSRSLIYSSFIFLPRHYHQVLFSLLLKDSKYKSETEKCERSIWENKNKIKNSMQITQINFTSLWLWRYFESFFKTNLQLFREPCVAVFEIPTNPFCLEFSQKQRRSLFGNLQKKR